MTDWDRYGLPTLRALAGSGDRNLRDGILFVGHGERGSERLGLDFGDGELFEGLLQLRDLNYVEFSEPTYDSGPGAAFTDLRVAGRGLQVLGEWPRFEAMVSPATLAEVIERLAEFAPSEDQRTRLQKVGAYVRGRSAGALKATAITTGAQIARGIVGLP